MKDLREKYALILFSHGVLTGTTIPDPFNTKHRFDLPRKTQVGAMSCNTRLIEVPPDGVEAIYMTHQPNVRRFFACPTGRGY